MANQLATVAGLEITSWELILSLFLLGIGVLFALILGKERVFVLLLGSYISFALMNVVPFKKFFPIFFQQEENFVVSIILFLVLIGLIYFVFSRSILKPSIRKRTGKSVVQSLFLSWFLIGIIMSVAFSFFPNDLISQFSPVILKIFNTSLAKTLWLIVPLIFMGIFRNKRSI